jgi:hypothetical protein
MNRARSRLALFALLGPAALVALGATPVAARPQAPDASGDDAFAAQRAFFENLRAFCGQTFGGRTIFAEPDDRTFEPARLYMVVAECGEDEIRVPFIVDGDASRTWVFQLRDGRLSFFHRHVRPDGREHDVSGFGGHASQDGTATFQSFPDWWATDETPAYYLDRGGRPAYRLVFWLGSRPREMGLTRPRTSP